MRFLELFAFAATLLASVAFAAPIEKRSAPDITQELADPEVGISPST
jgi:hypothetical protein